MKILGGDNSSKRYQQFIKSLPLRDLINLHKIFGLQTRNLRGGYLSRGTLVKTLLQKHPDPPILPIPHQRLPRESPFPKITCGDVFRCILKKPSTQADRTVWRPLVEEVTQQINHLCKDGVIPSGTLLYHGSLESSLDFFTGNKPHPFFFGIEESISLWYIYEAWLHLPKRQATSKRFGYLYTLEITQPIPVTEIVGQVIKHPNEIKGCWERMDGVCIHPQQIFHGDSDTIRDLGVEVTLRPDYFRHSLQVKGAPIEISIQQIQDLIEIHESSRELGVDDK